MSATYQSWQCIADNLPTPSLMVYASNIVALNIEVKTLRFLMTHKLTGGMCAQSSATGL
jgi:hypothetical protein